MTDRRKSLSLAAVLAATVLTGGAAILGMNHSSVAAAQTAPAATVVQQAPAPGSWEGGDR
ncbi:MAG TPA: hypothetical protein VKC62_04135 [Gaiellaceae bacterium]|nr:hypothetical protein [Gaiellaceae bacterium]